LKLKEYNKMIKSKKKIYKNTLVSQLHDMLEEDPSMIWKTLRKLRESEDSEIRNRSYININKWTEHLKTLVGSEPDVNIERKAQVQHMFDRLENIDNPFLYKPITTKEIVSTIKRLKNKKSSGKDGIINEMIKSITPDLLEILEGTFNTVLNTGIYPYEWKTGITIAIHKNGSPLNPENYRGITLTNAIGKLFCQILNCRISEYLE
jgi:hypothetical protein